MDLSEYLAYVVQKHYDDNNRAREMSAHKFGLTIKEVRRMKIKVPDITCKRCGHSWIPRVKEVRKCPGCGSAWFDEEKKEKEEE